MIGRALSRIRSAFLAGIFVVIPVGVSLWVLVLLVSFLESAIHLVPAPYRPEALIGRPIPGLGVLLAITVVIVVGVSMQNFVGRRLLGAYEKVIERVPGLSTVYQGVKQMTESVLKQDSSAFKHVVLVEWPRKGIYSLAFHTGEAWAQGVAGDVRMLNVFLPSTPNPTTGFYFMVPEDQVIVTTLTIEDAAKLLMSAGIVEPSELQALHTGEALINREGPPDGRLHGVELPPLPGVGPSDG